MAAFTGPAIATASSTAPLRATDAKPQRGVMITAEQLKVIEAVRPDIIKKPQGLRKATRRVPLASRNRKSVAPHKLNASGSSIQGWRTSAEYTYTDTPSGWYELNYDGTENLLWEWHDPDWVNDGSSEEPTFPFKAGFTKDGKIIGFQGEVVLFWLIWGYGSFSFDGQILEKHTFGEDLSVTDFSTFVITCVYDENADKAYAYTLNPDISGYMFQEIDLKTWKFTPIVNDVAIDNICTGLAYNTDDGKIYGYTPDAKFVTLDTSNGELTLITKLDLPVSTYYNGMVYNPIDKQFTMVFTQAGDNYGDNSDLYSISPDGYMSYLATLEYCKQYPILVTPDRPVDHHTPVAPEFISTDFPQGALSGKVVVRMPGSTIDGSPLRGKVTLNIAIDGGENKQIESTPSAAVEVPFSNLQEGNHEFTLSATSGELTSAQVSSTVFIGFDTPMAPDNIELTENTLSWDAVSYGVNGGYIDTDNLTYNIYLDGKRLNETPIKDCSYTVVLPDMEYSLLTAEVEADNHGRLSDRGFSNAIKHGHPFALPLSMTPTASEADLLEFNIKHDRWHVANGTVIIHTTSREPANICMMLPPVTVPETDKLIEISFDANITENWLTEKVNEKISFGVSPTGSFDDITIFDTKIIEEECDWSRLTAYCHPDAGTCYFAIITETNLEHDQVQMRNIKVSESDRICSIPVAVSNLSAKAYDKGALGATITFDMPTTSADGKDLPATAIKATVISSEETKTVSGMPGSHQSVGITTAQGINKIKVITSNAEEGLDATVKVFTGVDVPAPLSAINISHNKDFRGLHLKWETPQTGYNGGYVDPSDVTYSLCLYNPDEYSWEVAEDLGKSTEYDYIPGITNGMEVAEIGILTNNSLGNCGILLTSAGTVGTPYQFPVMDGLSENFKPMMSDYPDESYSTEWGYVDSAYPYHVSSPSPYGEGALLAWGEEGQKARVAIPAFTTEGVDEAAVEMTLWCGPSTGETVIYAEAYGIEPLKIGSFSDTSTEGWKKIRFNLPQQFMGREWVVLKFDAVFDAPGSMNAIGMFIVKTFQEKDAAVMKIGIEDYPVIGSACPVTATVENVGSKEMELPEVDLITGNDSKTSKSIRMTAPSGVTSLKPFETAVFTTEWIPTADNAGETQVKVSLSDDMDNSNNSLEQIVNVSRGNEGVITDLKASPDEDFVVLSWTEPDMGQGFESFENFTPYYLGEKIGNFTNLNLDGLESNYFAAFRFPHDSESKAWQIFDVNVIQNLADENSLDYKFPEPCTGNNIITAFSPMNMFVGESQSSDRWLISPEVKPGSTFSFMLTTGLDGYFEYLEVLSSSTDNKPESFTRLEKLTILSSGWKKYEYTLPDDARYFAIRYIGNDNSSFAAVDDIRYEPVDEAASIVGYDIYRDGVCINENVDTRSGWVDRFTVPVGGARYNVVPVISRGETTSRGAMSNTASAVASGIQTVGNQTIRIVSGHGWIEVSGCGEMDVRVFSTDGRLVAGQIRAASTERFSVAPGIYLVKVGGNVSKIAVK